MTEELRCLLEAICLLAMFGFWGLASRRWGGGVDTSLHPMRGGSIGAVNVFFAFIVLALMLLVIYSNLK